MNEIDQIISNAANNAAEETVKGNRSSGKSIDAYDKKPINTQFYSHKYMGLSDKARKILAKVYLMRTKSFKDQEWVDLYQRWLVETDHKFHDENTGLKDLVTMSVYYWERYSAGRRTMQKQKNMEGFSSLNEYALHEIRNTLDINYDN